jgi:hypothetical protein
MNTPGMLAAALAMMFPVIGNAQDHTHAMSAEKLGSVSFATSGDAAAALPFNRAVALLHSFEFGQAIDGFGATLKADPSCAMAEWGIALSRWSNPFAAGIRPPALLQQGRDAVDRARAVGIKTARELRREGVLTAWKLTSARRVFDEQWPTYLSLEATGKLVKRTPAGE